MTKPQMTEREFALEKQRRLREGVFFYLYEKKKWRPELEFNDDIIRSYVNNFKRRVGCEMKYARLRAKQNKLEQEFVKQKKREIPWEIESQFLNKKEFILDLIRINIPD